MDTTTIRDYAERWAIEAGTLLMDQFHAQHRVVSDPSVKNFSTELDIGIQRQIHHHIRSQFPDHAFLGEEEDQTTTVGSGYTWVVDPLDGTLNYFYGVPFFCVAIGVLKDRVPHVGVIYDPVSREIYTAERGQGQAQLLDTDKGTRTPLVPARETELRSSVVMTHITTNVRHLEELLASRALERLAREARNVRMLGASELGLAYVAGGRFHAFFNTYIRPWDVVAGHVILEAAGGVVSDASGQPWTPESRSIVGACTHELHQSLLRLLRPAQEPAEVLKTRAEGGPSKTNA